MWKCICCEKENQDTEEVCIYCEHVKTMDYVHYRTLSKVTVSTVKNWKVDQNNTEYLKKQAVNHLKEAVKLLEKTKLNELDAPTQNMLNELKKYLSPGEKTVKEKSKKVKKEIVKNISRPVIMAASKNSVFGEKVPRESICEIEFIKTNTTPNGAWDISENRSKTIWAWIDITDSGRILKVGSENGVYANPNCEGFFSGYSNVKRIKFNNLFDTSKVTNMKDMFVECGELEDVDTGRFDTSKVADMTCMFAFCNKLKNLDVNGFNTSRVTDMSGMFAQCYELKKLDVSGFDTRKVTDMSYMFQECSGLIELNTGSFDTGKVTKMNGMFIECTKLKKLNVSSFDTSNVKEMEGMFYGCKSLKEIDTSRFITDKISDITNLFEGCKCLGNIEILNKFELDKRINHRNYAGNNIETICENFLSYEDNRCIDNAQKSRTMLIEKLQIKSTDTIYILYDASWRRSGKNGFAVTNKGVYIKEAGKSTEIMYWKDFKKCTEITRYLDTITANGQSIAYFTGPKEILLQLEVMLDAIHKYLNNRILR